MDTQPTKKIIEGTTTFTYVKYLETCLNCKLGNNAFETLIKNRTLIDDYSWIWFKRFKKCLSILNDIGINGNEHDENDFARWLAFYAFDDFFCLPESEIGEWPMKWMNHTKQLYKKFENKSWDWYGDCYGQCELYENFLQEEMVDGESILGEDLDYGKVFDFYLKSKKTYFP